MQNKIGIQGGESSYHEQAAQQLFGNESELTYLSTFPEVFQQLRDGKIGKAVVAIANNRYNFIPAPFAMLSSASGRDFWIAGETYVHVEHQLLGIESATLDTVAEVHSQAPALGQCMNYLDSNLAHVPLVEQDDTALSAQLVAKWQDPSKVAIASRGAGKLYGLKVVAENIQDDEHNYTRFLVLEQRNQPRVIDGDKTSIVLQTSQAAGSLVDALVPFKEHGINIDTLHSSYLPNSKFTMQFFMEFNAGIQQDNVMYLLKKLATEQRCRITVLGSYKSGTVPMEDTKTLQNDGELFI
jgi:prephenate dehydratase